VLEMTVSVAVPNGPVLVGDIVALNPFVAETDRKTVLLNPFTPCMLMADVPDIPTARLRLVGLGVIVKSGTLEVTVTDMVAEWDKDPLTPEIISV